MEDMTMTTRTLSASTAIHVRSYAGGGRGGQNQR